jgi:hypothetical protein
LRSWLHDASWFSCLHVAGSAVVLQSFQPVQVLAADIIMIQQPLAMRVLLLQQLKCKSAEHK